MNRRFLLLMALLVCAQPAFSQERNSNESLPWANKFFTGKEEAPPAVIVHDFGTLPKGTVRTHRFTMTNIYAVPMQLVEPKPSCGCVSVMAYTGKMDPKQTGHIDVKIDTSRVEGQKQVQIPVVFVGTHPKTGEEFKSIARLEIKAVSRPDIYMNPGAIAFGTLPVGNKNTQSMTLTYSGRMSGWKIMEVGYKKEMFSVDVKPLESRSGTSYLLAVTLKEDVAAGVIEDQIILKTNDPTSPVLTVNVTGKLQSSLSLAPSELMNMGSVAIGQKLEKNIIVRADKPFKIESIMGEEEGITVARLPVPAAKTQVVTVIFEPTKVGSVKKVLTVKADTGDTVNFTVEANGILGAKP